MASGDRVREGCRSAQRRPRARCGRQGDHLVGLDFGNSGVGARLSPGFERPAATAVEALREKDCGAFRMSAFALYGPGATEQACAYVRSSAFGQALGTDPVAKPVLSGGNSRYAFYTVRTSSALFTMVLARDPRAGQASFRRALRPRIRRRPSTGIGTLPPPRRRESAAELETRGAIWRRRAIASSPTR